MNRDSGHIGPCILSCVTAVPHDIKTKELTIYLKSETKITKVLFLSNHYVNTTHIKISFASTSDLGWNDIT